MSRERILTILEKHEGKQGALISILEEIQSEFSYLPESALRVVADTTGRSLVEVMGVATFYRSFSLKPRGRHLMSVCLGTACHVRRAPKIADLQAAGDQGGGNDGGPGVYLRDRQLSRRLRSGPGGRRRRALLPSRDAAEGLSDHREDPGGPRQDRPRDRQEGLPAGSALPALQPQLDGRGPQVGRSPCGAHHGVVRAQARVDPALVAVRKLHDGVGARDPARHRRSLLLPTLPRRARRRLDLRSMRGLDGPADRSRRRDRADLFPARLQGTHARCELGSIDQEPPGPRKEGARCRD